MTFIQSLLLLCLISLATFYETHTMASPTVIYNLADETPAGALIGNIAESLPPGFGQNLTFILIMSKRFQYLSDFFRLTNTGDLITLKFIDRDNTNQVCGPLSCCNLAVCEIHATVIVTQTTEQIYNQSSTSAHQGTEKGILEQTSIHVLIQINDANDNPPHFSPLDYNDSEISKPLREKPFIIYLREGEPTTSESLPFAVDADSQTNGVVEYRLVEISEPHQAHMRSSLAVTTRSSSSKQLNSTSQAQNNEVELLLPFLIQTRALDYEDEQDRQINAVLLAVDGGLPPLTGTLSIVVHLLDINDNAPVFKYAQEDIYVVIPENTTMENKPIIVLEATDEDSGENGRITFTLSPLATSAVYRKFTVDSITGAIRIQRALDYELYSERHFILPLIAKDAGTPQRSATISLHVKVKDINDNKPIIIVQENITVPEGEMLTKPVMKFYIKDDDEVSQGHVHCDTSNNTQNEFDDAELLAGSRFLRLHKVSDTVFFIFTKDVMDFETTPRASLILQCLDNASSWNPDNELDDSELNTFQRIRITVAVQDRNDNSPQFNQNRYSVRLPEHSPEGTFVIQVAAFDADAGEYGEVSYHLGHYSFVESVIESPKLQLTAFTIDRSGKVEVLLPSRLDRELASKLNLQVIAKDKGGLSASAEVQIDLIDINDCSPHLLSPTELSLLENQIPGSIVGRIHFIDHDQGKNARIHIVASHESESKSAKYIRIASDPNFRYSTLLPKNGTIRNRKIVELVGDGEVRALLLSQVPVDRETNATLFFRVVAFDEGEPVRSVTATVTIVIGDQNDNAPKLIFPLSDTVLNSKRKLYTNSPPHSYITHIRANDPDKGENGTVIFRLETGTNGSSLFSLNSTSGELVTSWPIPNDDQETDYVKNWKTMRFLQRKALPDPGVYMITITISDKGKPVQARQHHFFVKISPTNHSISNARDIELDTSQNILAFPTHLKYSRYVLVTLALISVIALISTIVFCLWVKSHSAQQTVKSAKAQVNEHHELPSLLDPSECSPIDRAICNISNDVLGSEYFSNATAQIVSNDIRSMMSSKSIPPPEQCHPSDCNDMNQTYPYSYSGMRNDALGIENPSSLLLSSPEFLRPRMIRSNCSQSVYPQITSQLTSSEHLTKYSNYFPEKGALSNEVLRVTSGFDDAVSYSIQPDCSFNDCYEERNV